MDNPSNCGLKGEQSSSPAARSAAFGLDNCTESAWEPTVDVAGVVRRATASYLPRRRHSAKEAANSSSWVVDVGGGAMVELEAFVAVNDMVGVLAGPKRLTTHRQGSARR
jgi:hypothetical protein